MSSTRRSAARPSALHAAASPAARAARTCRDETCPVSTERWTRRVHFVREGGGGGGAHALAEGRQVCFARSKIPHELPREPHALLHQPQLLRHLEMRPP